MADEITTVNDLVTQHAAKQKELTEGANSKVEENKVDTNAASGGEGGGKKEDIPIVNPVDDLLKEFNLESLDALKERLKPKPADKQETPEEKEKRENLYKVEMQKYAVENGLMKPDDFTRLDNLKSKEDQAVVFENWLPGWKEENPDVDPADADRQSKEDFESEYKLDSKNEKTKARGIAKIQQEAKLIRNPLETSYSKVKQDFDDERSIQAEYPAYNKKVSGFIQENIPAKVKLWETKDGEESIPVEIELTDEQRKDIYQKVAKKVLNSGTYEMYKKGDEKGLQGIAKQEAESLIWAEHREAGLKKIADTFLARGKKQGSTTGAKNPFPLVGEGKGGESAGSTSAAQQVLDSLQGKK